ncbi:hypothetical protein UFOVP75_115 [uncultured Caudovirales phage]|uniref:Uncharacterized protein n=1 Tax=uncultured Caudovirales phage TaxID=2100421 RepID=A0A6J5L121_9CAUD|nr:hypothetical protein UFOVP75_115 [uncultured Caudovirales phage]
MVWDMDDVDEETEQISEEEIDTQLEDVEMRLEIAGLYKLFITGDLFVGIAQTDAVKKVEARFRQWARHELKVLLGMDTPKERAAGFSNEEVELLKQWAGKLAQRASGAPSTPAPAPINPVSIAPRVEAPKPSFAPRTLPGTAPKPVVAPPTKPVVKPIAKPAKTRKANRVIERREMERGAIQTSVVDGKLKREYINEKGEVIEARDISPQVRPPGAIPMPNAQQMAMVSQQMAQNSLDASGINSSSLSTALAQTIMNQG